MKAVVVHVSRTSPPPGKLFAPAWGERKLGYPCAITVVCAWTFQSLESGKRGVALCEPDAAHGRSLKW